MFTARHRRRASFAAIAAVAALTLTACGGDSDPLATGGTAEGSSAAIVIGSQGYYSNAIIAEIYAQALEAGGYEVTRQFEIGEREVYLPSLESGEIDLFPEYTGNLLQALDPDATAQETDAVYAALSSALPTGLRALDQAPATDQDSYVVTQAFSDENGVTSIADLADVADLTLGGNAELQERPYGPAGLESAYGVTVSFLAIGDSGGPLTVQALQDGTIDIGNIYTGDPNVQSNGFVLLEDPEGLFLASNIVPVASDAVDAAAADIIDEIQAALTQTALLSINSQSQNDQRANDEIAADFLSENGLV